MVKGKDGNILRWMQNANEHFYYALSRSVAINGLSQETVVKETVYWWQPSLIALCACIGLMTVGAAAMFVKHGYFKKGEK